MKGCLQEAKMVFSFMMLRSWWQATICAFCMHLRAPTPRCRVWGSGLLVFVVVVSSI